MASTKRGVISHRDFIRDLGRGAVGEDIAEAFFLEEFGLTTKNVSDRNPDFDLLLCGLDESVTKQRGVVPDKMLKKIFKDLGFPSKDEITVEVKFDEAAAKYKNFFIEIYYNIETGVPGNIFKSKCDLIVWIVPGKKRSYHLYIFNRAFLLAWIFNYLLEHKKGVKFKSPAISPYARGVPVPITLVQDSPACLGSYVFKY